MTITLTNDEANQIEETARERGITPDVVLHDAVSAYLQEIPQQSSKPSEPHDAISGVAGRPDLWFIPGPLDVPATSDIASRFDEVLAESFTQFLLEAEVSYVPKDESKDHAEPTDQGGDGREQSA